jgi:hypothetical protein
MRRDEFDELMSFLTLLGSLYEDLSQRVAALENNLRPAERKRYDDELVRIKNRGGSTNVATGLEALRQKFFPDHQ